ncbi:hypothetical protein BFP97_04540 [Roseivirga sp. 4D4]|uniref:hypothetical protein n=1 Tax=Roseivirga sp. 4D4 TaxID=1889784 RepID=UPI000852A571|nr:hypothetical protein [Roseivirga sp. 4D4]OEK00821.1 hypothetical protein BFP97_04540 [Roseivirga sp. 4D4]
MGRAERRANRQARKTQRRRLIAAVKNAIENNTITFKPDDDGAEPPFADVFNQIWPILDPALKFTETYTNDATDAVLQEVWAAGSAIANGGGDADASAFQAKFDQVWDKISFYLELAQTFTNDATDKVIDEVLDIGDWIAGDGQ